MQSKCLAFRFSSDFLKLEISSKFHLIRKRPDSADLPLLKTRNHRQIKSPNKFHLFVFRCFCLESHRNIWVNHLKICNKDPDLWYDLFFRYQLIILRTQLTLHIIFILLFRSKTVSQSFSVQEALEEARRGKMAVGVFLLLSLFQIFPFYNLYILSPSYHGGTLLQ